MTTIYDPTHPLYSDEADVRGELTRVFDVCVGCRRCSDMCGSFPTLFMLIDRHGHPDAGWLTPAEQDQVVDRCVQCGRCALDCPFHPDLHELAIDFPRLMARTTEMRRATGQLPLVRHLAASLGRLRAAVARRRHVRSTPPDS